jgi:hypothetical protein
MGGNALKEHNTIRLDKKQYQKVELDVCQALRCLSNVYHFKVRPVKSYFTKDSFGDCDIVVDSRYMTVYGTERIIAALEQFYQTTIPHIKNGPVLSVAVPVSESFNFQVDLIFTDVLDFDFACRYYNWNDVGNLIGRVAHKMGLKFGHNGLWVVVREDTHVIGEICLTKDFNKAVEWLGFDSDQHEYGFYGYTDMFPFIAQSEFFNPDIYKLENRNHTARVRDKKRKTYTDFLQWLEKDGVGMNHHLFDENKQHYIQEAVTWFGKNSEYNAILVKALQAKNAKKKFNGNRVSELTGMKGKDLGNLMQYLKDLPFFTPSNIFNMHQTDVDLEVARSFNVWLDIDQSSH